MNESENTRPGGDSPPAGEIPSKPIRKHTRRRSMAGEKILVYVVVTTVVCFILWAVGWSSRLTATNYGNAINTVQTLYETGRLSAQDALTYRFAIACAQDAALIKGGALLLSFLVVILGVLVVLEGSKAVYSLNVEGVGKKSALEASSPGLVMITLGLALVYGVLMYKIDIDLSLSHPELPVPTQGPLKQADVTPNQTPGTPPEKSAKGNEVLIQPSTHVSYFRKFGMPDPHSGLYFCDK